MIEKKTQKINVQYFEKFGSYVPIFYTFGIESYINLFEAAKKAIEKGEELTTK